ncbi:MAG TPA: hypothetical protein PL106_00425 [Flavobacteriales bacterium]|nr:hypothetical protein [Flavobacteriales bacterium]
MPTAVIVDAIRTAGGKRNGDLSGWHSADLAAEVLKALVERNNLDPTLVDDVIMGCVMQVGAQSLNVGRNAVLAAGFPESVPATTIDRQCGSSQQSAHFAAQGVMAGAYDIAIAAGVEVMSLVPMGASFGDMKRIGFPFGEQVGLRYADQGGLVPQGISAEMIADKWGLSREDLDAFGAESQRRAAQAQSEGRFDNEIVAQICWNGHEIAEITCPTKYFDEASSINFSRSMTYGLGVVGTSWRYFLARTGLVKWALLEA